MIKSRLWITTRIGGLCLFLAAWVIADDAYRDFIQKEYLQCVFSKTDGSVDVFFDSEYYELRDNCALSLGPEYGAFKEKLFFSWSKSPIWKKILLLPSKIYDF
jgi:hypothetical protein